MLNHLLSMLIIYRYGMLAFLSFFEGSLVCLITGFLAHQGYFLILPAFLIIIAGDLVPNILFFAIGRFAGATAWTKRTLTRFSITEEHLLVIEKFWVKNTWKTMLLSKMAWSMGLPFFISAGMTKLSFSKYIGSMTVIAIIQYGIIFGLGYFLGHSYNDLGTYKSFLDVFGIVCTILIFSGLFIFLPRYAKKRLDSDSKTSIQ